MFYNNYISIFQLIMVHALKFCGLKFLIKWHVQTLQTHIKLSSLIRVFTVCHSIKYSNPDPAEPRFALPLQTV